MAFRFGDSFDHYTTNAQMAVKWTSVTATIVPSAGTGRNGTYAVSSSAGDIFNVVMDKTLDSQTTWVIGVAIYTTNMFINGENYIELRDSGSPQIGAYITNTGAIAVRRGGSGGTTLGTSVNTLSLDIWQYLEFKVTINNSGNYEVRVDGATWLSGSGDTQDTANAYAETIRFSMERLTWTRLDDLYICDGTGTANYDFLGDVRIAAIFPDAVGTYSQFAPTSGDNYTCVDETSPNNDTDFVATSGVGYVDTYNFSVLPVASGTIVAVQTDMFSRKDDVGTRKVSPTVYYNMTLFSGSENTLTSSYAYYLNIFEENPDTLAVWTVDEINNAEFGIKMEE